MTKSNLAIELHVMGKSENQDLIKIRECSLFIITGYSPQIDQLNITQKLKSIIHVLVSIGCRLCLTNYTNNLGGPDKSVLVV